VLWIYPFGVRARGRAAITAEWLGEKHLDTPGGYDAQYEPIAIDGDLVVAHGRTRFFDPLTGATQAEYDKHLGPPVRPRWPLRRVPRVVREAPGRRSSSRPAQPPAIGGMTCTRSPSRNGAPRTAVAPLTTTM